MSSVASRVSPARLRVGARVFGLVVLTPPVIAVQDRTAVLALIAVGVVWLATTAVEALGRIPVQVLAVGEAGLVGVVCALSLDSSLALLGSLAVPPFTASLRRGPRGVLMALSVELVALVPLSTVLRGPLDTEAGTAAFTWVVVGVGLGLIGSFVQSTLREVADPLTPYRDAQALIRELIDLSGSLGSGLDPISLATRVAEDVRDELPVSALVVSAARDDGLHPIVTQLGTQPGALDRLQDLAGSAVRTVEPVRDGNALAFPLMTDAGLVGVVACLLPSGLAPESQGLVARLDALAERLEPTAVHLDTALLFAALRDSAASDERRRLAREMHDGIAQDIASLGYLVDALVARPASPEQAAQLQLLRDRLSTVVAEVRRSVQSLRTEVGSSESLGAAIGVVARHLNTSAGVPIHVTLEESTSRLLHDVEAELLRIAQEAMTNAVRHAGASRIEVTCRVQAPRAEIVVRDDGCGLGPRRHDSQGIEIMHERARLIGAELTLENAQPHGTVVRVVATGLPHTDTAPDERVTA